MTFFSGVFCCPVHRHRLQPRLLRVDVRLIGEGVSFERYFRFRAARVEPNTVAW